MKNNILNEELQQMKYLFGYKPGKVISEQATSGVQPNPKQAAQPSTNNVQLFSELLNAINNKSGYVYSPNIPGKILANPSIRVVNTAYGQITFTLVAPSDGVVQGILYQMDFEPNSADVKLSTPQDVASQFKSNQLAVQAPKPVTGALPTTPLNTAEIMFFVNAEKNPKVFADFLQKNFGEKAKQSLINALTKRGNSMTKEIAPTPEEARNILQQLNVQTQPTQPTK